MAANMMTVLPVDAWHSHAMKAGDKFASLLSAVNDSRYKLAIRPGFAGVWTVGLRPHETGHSADATGSAS
jgi:hypothetical protein